MTEEKKPHIILVGDPENGYEAFGPFESKGVATTAAYERVDYRHWVVMPLYDTGRLGWAGHLSQQVSEPV